MYGGVWTARSREAGMNWSLHRRLLLATLGCDLCDNGRQAAEQPGSPFMLVETSVASRWQEPAVLRSLDPDEIDDEIDSEDARKM